MRDVMLDLETMGRGPDAPIIAIGAVQFDVEAGIGESFYRTVDLRSSVDGGAVIDPDTVLWWMKQSDAARGAFRDGGEPIGAVLDAFRDWLPARPRVWGNGAGFDNVILAAAYRRSGRIVPWEFWHDRCYRTIVALHLDMRRAQAGTHHNALDDALSQAMHLVEILRRELNT